jgi:predicted MFS family arabinose efflux permease
MSVLWKATPVSTDHPRYVDSVSFLTALTLICVTAMSSSTIAPIMLGLYVDTTGLTERLAGLVSASEAGGYVAAQLVITSVVHRWSRRGLALSSMAITVAGNIATLSAADFTTLAMARFVTGCGAGLALATMGASIAARKDPQRGYSIVILFALCYAAALLVVSGTLAQRFGLRGLIIAILALNGVGIVACSWVPARVVASDSTTRGTNSLQAVRALPLAIIRLSATLLVLYIGHNALWSYQERMGIALGLSRSTVGMVLGLSVVGGIAGAAAATAVGTRKGLTAPEICSILVLIVAALLVADTHRALIFVIAATLIKGAWFFGLPYLQAALAQLDQSGRAVVAAGSLQTLGTMLGTAGAAWVVPYGHEYLGLLGAVLYLMCIPLSLAVLVRLDRAKSTRALQREVPFPAA